MTTPPPKGGGFSLSRLGFTKAQSEPKYVACGVRVGVRGVAASLIEEHLPVTVVGTDMPAGVTGARRVARVDQDDVRTGAFSLVDQHVLQHPPTRVEDAFVQSALGGDIGSRLVKGALGRAGHVGDTQVFEHDQIVGVHQLTGQFVQEVATLVPNLPVRGSDPLNSLAAAYRTAALASEGLLSGSERILSLAVVARVGSEGAIGAGQQVRDTTVDSDDRTGQRADLRRDIDAHDVDVPVSSFAGDRELLDGPGDWSVLLDLDCADTLHPDGGPVELAPVTVDERHRVEALVGLEAWVAGSLAVLDATEECLERLVQSLEGLLLRGERPTPVLFIGTNLFELAGLVAVAHRMLALAVGIAAFLQRSVVHRAVIAQHLTQRDGLACGWVQAVAEDAVHLVPLPPRSFVLGVDVSLDGIRADSTYGSDEVGPRPQSGQARGQRRELRAQCARRESLELVGNERRRVLRPGLHEQVDVVGHDLQRDDPPAVLGGLLSDQFFAAHGDISDQHGSAVLRAPHDVVADVPDSTRAGANCATHN